MNNNEHNTVTTTTIPRTSSISTRIISGTIGAIVTSLVVTPFEVVKVLTQQQQHQHHDVSTANTTTPSSSSKQATTVTTIKKGMAVPCPKGCGTFIIYNGHTDCVLSKMSVPYFNKVTGTAITEDLLNNSSSRSIKNNIAHTTTTIPTKRPLASIGTFDMLRYIYKQKGLLGIYAGLRPTLIMAAPNTIMYYTAYEEIVYRTRQYLQNNSTTKSDSEKNHRTITYTLQQNQHWIVPLFAGGSARLLSSTLTAPLEYIRTRQAAAIGNTVVQQNRSTVSIPSTTAQRTGGNLFHELRNIVQNEGGISTLYRGLRPTLWRDVPFSALYWLLLEQLRAVWDRNRGGGASKITPFEQAYESFINGATAGMIAAACTTPFDVAKTRQQTATLMLQSQSQPQPPPTVPSTLRTPPVPTLLCTGIQNGKLTCNHVSSTAAYSTSSSSCSSTTVGSVGTGTFHQLRIIAQTEGINGLWRGNQARMLKVAPSCAIMLSSYELGKRLLE